MSRSHASCSPGQVQYAAVTKIAMIVAVLIFASYYLRPSADESNGVSLKGVQAMPNAWLGLLCSMSFVVGACCSAAAGYVRDPNLNTFTSQ